MEALHHVLVKADGCYNNTEKVGDVDFTVNVNIDDVTSINRRCIVHSAPKNSIVQAGDEVIIHHNIMRQCVGNDGKIDMGVNYIDNGLYWCEDSEIIMKKHEGKWVCLHDFVFIKPIPTEHINLDAGMVLVPDARKGMSHLRATLAITNDKVEGINIGDKLIYTNFSQHEFIIDGELLYKCEVEDLLGVVK